MSTTVSVAQDPQAQICQKSQKDKPLTATQKCANRVQIQDLCPSGTHLRRKQRRQWAKAKGKAPSQKGLVCDGWHLMLTNLTVKQASAEQLMSLYRSR